MASTGKHTPGPWKLNGLPNPTAPEYYCVYVKPGGPETVKHICQVRSRDGDAWKANARLIAGAPQLLKALKDAEQHMKNCNNGGFMPSNYAIVAIRAAIKAATEG